MKTIFLGQDADMQVGEWRDQQETGPWVWQLTRRSGQEALLIGFLDVNTLLAQARSLQASAEYAFAIASEKYGAWKCRACGRPVVASEKTAACCGWCNTSCSPTHDEQITVPKPNPPETMSQRVSRAIGKAMRDVTKED